VLFFGATGEDFGGCGFLSSSVTISDQARSFWGNKPSTSGSGLSRVISLGIIDAVPSRFLLFDLTFRLISDIIIIKITRRIITFTQRTCVKEFSENPQTT